MTPLDKLELSPSKLAWISENPVLLTYINKGYFNKANEIDCLHMSFSPYRVPSGLTKLQVRRRINKYLKKGLNVKESIRAAIGGDHIMVITIDGNFRARFGFNKEVPQTSKQFAKLLRQLANVITAPDVEDKEVLRKYCRL